MRDGVPRVIQSNTGNGSPWVGFTSSSARSANRPPSRTSAPTSSKRLCVQALRRFSPRQGMFSWVSSMDQGTRTDRCSMERPWSVLMTSLLEKPSRFTSCRTAGLREDPRATVFRSPPVCQTGPPSSWSAHNQRLIHLPPQQCSPVQQRPHQ